MSKVQVQATGLPPLTGEAGQANFDVVVKHLNLTDVVKALFRLNEAGLLISEAGQANFDVVARHWNPKGVADALIKLNTAGLLTGEAGQANWDVLALHSDPTKLANELVKQNRIELQKTMKASLEATRSEAEAPMDLNQTNQQGIRK